MSVNKHFEYDYLCLIGRFQPFHQGHCRIIDQALQLSRNVIILIGSADRARSIRNPFTFDERQWMIFNTYSSEYERLHISPLHDIAYNDQKWIGTVQEIVHRHIVSEENPSPSVTLHGYGDFRIGLIGYNKDNTSYYLKMFPGWGSVDVPQSEPIAATQIREDYFGHFRMPEIKSGEYPVPESTRQFLESFQFTSEYEWLREERDVIRKTQSQYGWGPHVATDAVVVQSGHVCLIQRGQAPGKGLWAFPGGFLKSDETICDSMLRELREETNLSDSYGTIPAGRLKSFITRQKVYDGVHRDCRGRIISHTFLLKLPNSTELFRIRGGDDAAHAAWVPIGTLRPELMYADHADIMENILHESI